MAKLMTALALGFAATRGRESKARRVSEREREHGHDAMALQPIPVRMVAPAPGLLLVSHSAGLKTAIRL